MVSGVCFCYEVIVGVGLLVIIMLCDLVDIGDEVLVIEGIFFGMLVWLFNCFDGS